MDRETLIGAIEQRKRIAERNNQAFVDLPYEIVGDAIAMLKKQETQKFFVDESGKITPLPVVVRCKDCKYWTVGDCGAFCPYHHDARPDWFCADGERR